jgi:hypothetical protein
MNKTTYNALKFLIVEELRDLGVISKRTGTKTLRVFDFDDTLAKTNSRVWVTEFDKQTGKQLNDEYPITPAEYAVFKTDVASQHPEKEYKFSYREFAEVVDPKIIDFTFSILRSVVSKLREESSAPAVILTARGHDANKNIADFLRSFDIDIPVVTLEGSAPELKSNWIKKAMLSKNIPHVEFFDDSPLNVKAVADLNSDNELLAKFGPDLKVRSRIIKAH